MPGTNKPKVLKMPDPASPNDPALLRIDGAVATITLNRPAAFNAIDLTIARKLEQLSAEIEANKDVRVLVIEGEGRAFCAGGDLQTIGAAAEANNIAPVVGEMLHHYHAFIETVRRMPKIVLSSVHGSAAGAGMGLAFVTDLCIAADDARFTPAYAKIGVSPDGGSTVGIVGTVGTRRALQIFLAEDGFTAQQAYEWGLVVKTVPATELKAATRQLAERLAKNPPAAPLSTIFRKTCSSTSSTTIRDRVQCEAEHSAVTRCDVPRRMLALQPAREHITLNQHCRCFAGTRCTVTSPYISANRSRHSLKRRAK